MRVYELIKNTMKETTKWILFIVTFPFSLIYALVLGYQVVKLIEEIEEM